MDIDNSCFNAQYSIFPAQGLTDISSFATNPAISGLSNELDIFEVDDVTGDYLAYTILVDYLLWPDAAIGNTEGSLCDSLEDEAVLFTYG